MKVNFVVNDKYILFYVLQAHSDNRFIKSKKELYEKTIVDFQNFAWDKSQKLYKIIDGRTNPFLQKALGEEFDFQHIERDLHNYVNELLKCELFKELLEETRETTRLCEKEWEKNLESSTKFIKSLGIEVPGAFETLMVHPGLKAGSYLGNNKICWSYQDYWQNYNTIYIWHEILHSFFGRTQEEHALIELITDNELRVRLNGGNYPPFEGHNYLQKQRERLLPHWQAYLKQDTRDTNQLLQQLKIVKQ